MLCPTHTMGPYMPLLGVPVFHTSEEIRSYKVRGVQVLRVAKTLKKGPAKVVDVQGCWLGVHPIGIVSEAMDANIAERRLPW